MNMQAIMKQAQAMQKDMMRIKNELDSTSFEGHSSYVDVVVNGKKEVLKVTISEDAKEVILDDVSLLEDMILVAVNDAFKKVDEETSKKMGKYSSMMSGLM